MPRRQRLARARRSTAHRDGHGVIELLAGLATAAWTSLRWSWSLWLGSSGTRVRTSARQRPLSCRPAARRADQSSPRGSSSCWPVSPRTRTGAPTTRRFRRRSSPARTVARSSPRWLQASGGTGAGSLRFLAPCRTAGRHGPAGKIHRGLGSHLAGLAVRSAAAQSSARAMDLLASLTEDEDLGAGKASAAGLPALRARRPGACPASASLRARQASGVGNP